MKKIIVVLLFIGITAAFAQLANTPNMPKPNDSEQMLTFKIAQSTNGGMLVPAHDAEVFTYSGSNLSQITYKRGGVNGVTVGIMIYTYNGSTLTSSSITVQ